MCKKPKVEATSVASVGYKGQSLQAGTSGNCMMALVDRPGQNCLCMVVVLWGVQLPALVVTLLNVRGNHPSSGCGARWRQEEYCSLLKPGLAPPRSLNCSPRLYLNRFCITWSKICDISELFPNWKVLYPIPAKSVPKSHVFMIKMHQIFLWMLSVPLAMCLPPFTRQTTDPATSVAALMRQKWTDLSQFSWDDYVLSNLSLDCNRQSANENYGCTYKCMFNVCITTLECSRDQTNPE